MCETGPPFFFEAWIGTRQGITDDRGTAAPETQNNLRKIFTCGLEKGQVCASPGHGLIRLTVRIKAKRIRVTRRRLVHFFPIFEQ